MTTCLLVCTADVENCHNIIPGRLPGFSLSARGRRHAEAVSVALAKQDLVAIYTCPLPQARETSTLIAKHHKDIPVYATDLLTDVRTSWQGEPLSFLEPHSNFYEPRRHASDESIEDLYFRMEHIIARIIPDEYPDQTITCISHRDPILAFCLGTRGEVLDFDRLRAARAAYAGAESITAIRIRESNRELEFMALV